MTSLAVDKIKKKVTMGLSDQRQLSGHLFLSAYSESGVGRQTVLELLTGKDRFIPFETSEGEFTFLNQSHIIWLAAAQEKGATDTAAPPPRHTVNVVLQGGKKLRGDLVMAMPEEKSRLSDVLNEITNFMVIRDEKKEILVNVDFVVRVV